MHEPRKAGFDFEATETTSAPVVAPLSPGDPVIDREGARRRGFVGTGLGATMLGAILGVSTVSFFFWGGALWRVAPGSSHVARIAGSYFIVVPLVAAALAASRRWSLQHFLGSIALLWGAKLVITATAYSFIAPGSATDYAPARTWESKAVAPPGGPGHQTASANSAGASISGRIVAGGSAVDGAAVVLGEFDARDTGVPPVDIPLVIERSRYAKTIYVSSSRDRFLVTNRDGVLHTLRFVRDRSAASNVPVLPGPSRPVAMPPPGAYEMSCENHTSEQASLVVVDHEHIAFTDLSGRFELHGLPAGDRELIVLLPDRAPVHRFVSLADNGALELSVDVR